MFRAALSGAPARRFFAAHAQSCLGTGLAYVALPLLAYDRFQTPWAIAAVLLPELLPAIVLGPLLGALVDRVGWRSCAIVADVMRAAAFAFVVFADSLPLMVVGAVVAGLGTALFTPSALAGLPRLVGEAARPGAMGLYGALDDVGLTAGPALAAGLLAVVGSDVLMGVNAVTFLCSALLLSTIPGGGGVAVARSSSLLADARLGVVEIAGRPELRVLIVSSASVVLCVGVMNVGEVVFAREVLAVGGSGLALIVTANGVGTMVGSLCTRFTGGSAWIWRRAYLVGIIFMAVELVACAVLQSFWLVVAVFLLGGFGNGLALVHDRLLLSSSTPEGLHGRVFALHKTCTSLAFALSFLASSALITGVGVQAAFALCAAALLAVFASALPRLRAAWPSPRVGSPPALGDALA